MVEYRIALKPSAIRDLDRMRKYDATAVLDTIERHLTHAPTRESKSRIKKLRGIRHPDYRLRAGAFRVFYAVDEGDSRVDVLRVLHKGETSEYYEELLK